MLAHVQSHINFYPNSFVYFFSLSPDNCGALYYGKQDSMEGSSPLLVWPHGGPHSAFTNSFSSVTSFFALLGKIIAHSIYMFKFRRN